MKVLIVDDSILLRERLTAMISELPEIEVIGQAESAEKAINSIRILKPDVMILDIRMPGGNGFEVLENIKRDKSTPLMIVLTSYPYPQYRKKCLDSGADYFFDKSTEFHKVVEVLKKFDELVGKPMNTIYAPESLPKIKENLAKWKKTGELKNEEMVAITKDGKRRKDGKILNSVSVHKDITQRKLAEKELREKEEFNFALFQHNPIETIVVDHEGRVVKINMAKRKSGDKVPSIGDVMYKDYAGRHEIDMCSELMECMRQGKTKTFPELKYDDKFLNISIASFPKGAIITSQDITKQKRAEKEKERLQAQLIQSEKMAGIGTLASGISHEFNNLLHIMRGHAEFAQSTKKAKDMEEALDMVLKTSDEVAKIVGDLLTFAREKPSKKRKELGDIAESIEGVLSLMEEHLRKQNIEVVRKYGKTPRIEMNMREMQQVFLYIVNNARDAMLPKGGKLEIETKQLNGNIEVSISDTGKGIEKENLGKLFEPFYTTKRTEEDDREFPGTGLGLSVSYGIVKRHGGMIEVKSKVNKGTTFTVKLPLKEKKRKSQDKNK